MEKVKGTCDDITCNIWERARIRRNITHSLAGGGTHNLGYRSIKWEAILHGQVDPLGNYPVAKYLPDKIARFLFEFHGDMFQSLGLYELPPDRRGLNVHGMLKSHQASDHKIHNLRNQYI